MPKEEGGVGCKQIESPPPSQAHRNRTGVVFAAKEKGDVIVERRSMETERRWRGSDDIDLDPAPQAAGAQGNHVGWARGQWGGGSRGNKMLAALHWRDDPHATAWRLFPPSVDGVPVTASLASMPPKMKMDLPSGLAWAVCSKRGSGEARAVKLFHDIASRDRLAWPETGGRANR